MERVNVRDKLALFSDHWNPRVVGELNGQHVKLVKFQGEFVWHDHAAEDELFLVVRGSFRMDFRDRSVTLQEGVHHRSARRRASAGGRAGSRSDAV
jgi:mannose-6-phosphate isomerase-like protein (cupin superfamily)